MKRRRSSDKSSVRTKTMLGCLEDEPDDPLPDEGGSRCDSGVGNLVVADEPLPPQPDAISARQAPRATNCKRALPNARHHRLVDCNSDLHEQVCP